MSRSILPALLAATLLGSAVSAEPVKERLQPKHVFDLEWVEDPRIAPDGKSIVYVRRSMDIQADRRRAVLWTVGADGGRHRPVTEPGTDARSPRWSPDGDRLAYITSNDGTTEIHVQWVDSGKTGRIARLEQSPRSLSWSPDGERIAFIMKAKKSEESRISMPERPEGAECAEPPSYIDELIYRSDGGGYVSEGYDHVFVLPADGGTPRQLTQGDFNHQGPINWTPDGSALVFGGNRHEDWRYDPLNTEIYRLTLDDGVITALTDRQGPDNHPVLSPDGKRIAYTGFDDEYQGYQVDRLYVMDADGSNQRVISADLDRGVSDARWHSNGRMLFFKYDDEGRTHLAGINLSGDVELLASDLGGTSLGRPYSSGSFTVSDDNQLAFNVTTTDRPADVATIHRGNVRRLTSLNEDLMGHRELASVEEIRFESSHDGREIQGWIAKPPDFDPDNEYPMILEIHGGPFANYGPRFSTEVQLYANAGYVVLYVNPRGSTSYGQAFGNAIHHDYPGNDYDDLMSGVDALLEQGYVDADRLYVTGGSGGGVLSAWIVGHTDRFRAAVVAKPVINWYSFALTADVYNFFYKYWFPGLPWNHLEHYMERSPISYAGEVTTPTMVLTGESDYRTPISESEQFYQALKLAKVESAMVRVPGASHHIAARPSHLIAKVQYILHWFGEHDDDKGNADKSDEG
jgi:acylaminoacyl-peptidase